MKKESEAEIIVNGILDTVERTGYFSRGRLMLGQTLRMGVPVPTEAVLADWVEGKLHALRDAKKASKKGAKK